MEAGIKEAKNNLSKLIDAALAGEEVFLTNRGDRVAQVIPVKKSFSLKSGWGSLKGKVKLFPGWDSPEADRKIEEMFK